MVLRLKTWESRSSPGLPRAVSLRLRYRPLADLSAIQGPIRALIEIIPLFHDRWFTTSGLATKRQKPPPDHFRGGFFVRYRPLGYLSALCLRLGSGWYGQAQRRHLDVSRFPAKARAPARASRRAVLGEEGLGRLVDPQGRICGGRGPARRRQARVRGGARQSAAARRVRLAR